MAETTDLKLSFPEELYKKLQELAASRSMSVEDYVRDLIELIANRPE